MGLLGILGGAALLAAFAVPIPLNAVRLVMFNTGAAAVSVGIYQRAPGIGVVGIAPAVVANAWYALMVLLSLAVAHPFGGDFGLVFFAAGAAIWLADAWFGLALLAYAEHHWTGRATGLALLVGSLLAFTGLDRLGLSQQGDRAVFDQLALTGLGLNGCAWIMLGGWLLLRGLPSQRRMPDRQA